MLLSKKIKIEVSEQDAQALEWMQSKCRGLYNWWVMRLCNGERWNFSNAKQSLQESKQYDPELRLVWRKRQIRNRMVYNDWGLYSFVQMLTYKCLRFGKELHIIDERDTTKMCHVCKCKQNMPLWVRTYRCENCGLVMDRDENSAINIFERFLARPGPHTL
jgi:hypothetical protein